ncbi:MAG: PepSY domain-containing protein [Acidimicrobiaceae bacterium]|nr:PepSY domain-containing protein [Acidimicrobiaceae bacterium]
MSDWIDKLKNFMTPRKVIFIVAGLLVVVFVARGCSGIDLSREEAEAIATAAFEADDDYFEPEKIESRVLRQGIPTRAVWIVVFTVADPDGTRTEFLNHATVRVDAGTGEVIEVDIGEPDG